MTNWTLIGPAPWTSFFNDRINLADSTGFLTVNRLTDGGNWVEYTASWPEDTNRLRITIYSASTKNGSISIGIGTAPERLILEFPATARSVVTDFSLELPITIRAGERVSVRPDSDVSGDFFITLHGYYDSLFRTDLRYSDLIGKVSDTSLTVPDPEGIIHTKGAWLQMIASTANDYKAIVILFQQKDSADTTLVKHIFDIGVGGDGSEIVLLKDIYVERRGKLMRNEHQEFFITAHLPAGVRLAVRCQADNIVSGVRNLTGAAVIGLY